MTRFSAHAVLVVAINQMQVVVTGFGVWDGPLIAEVEALARVAAITAVNAILLPAGHHLRAKPPTILPVGEGLNLAELALVGNADMGKAAARA